MSIKLLILSAFVAACDAFAVVGRPMLNKVARAGTAAPTMTAPVEALVNLPTTLIADDISPIFLASATGSLVFVLLIVATIVINFGIMKK